MVAWESSHESVNVFVVIVELSCGEISLNPSSAFAVNIPENRVVTVNIPKIIVDSFFMDEFCYLLYFAVCIYISFLLFKIEGLPFFLLRVFEIF